MWKTITPYRVIGEIDARVKYQQKISQPGAIVQVLSFLQELWKRRRVSF